MQILGRCSINMGNIMQILIIIQFYIYICYMDIKNRHTIIIDSIIESDSNILNKNRVLPSHVEIETLDNNKN